MEEIILGGGCFWCVEAVYNETKGVISAISGYAGGSTDNPTYYEVGAGTTGHAEVVKVTFDPEIISRDDILRIFFTIHDPTTLNRQGADVGTMYRSIVLFNSEEQKNSVEKILKEAQEYWDNPIVTEVAPLTTFYEAEDYHQNYYAKNPGQGYCRAVISPKLSKFRKKFSHHLK